LTYKKRFLFVDLLRGWALIIMIEVHVFNSMLMPPLTKTVWFGILDFINGLVAPSFLFVSGAAFTFSIINSTNELRNFGKTFWRKIRRIFLIFAAGYSLRLPYFTFYKLFHKTTGQQLIDFYNVDILQCIGAGLLLLLLLRIIFKKDKAFNLSIWSLMIIMVLIAPLIWSINFHKYFPLAIAAYFNPKAGSLFPVFPWIAFMLAGALASNYFLKYRNEGREKFYFINIFVISLAFIFSGHLFLSVLFHYSVQTIRPHPLFFIERLGYVLLAFILCWYYERNRGIKNTFILEFSRESLLVYWLHLILLYGKYWSGKSIVKIVGKSFNVYECLLFTILFIILMGLIAKFWSIVKNRYPDIKNRILLALTGIFLIIFFWN